MSEVDCLRVLMSYKSKKDTAPAEPTPSKTPYEDGPKLIPIENPELTKSAIVASKDLEAIGVGRKLLDVIKIRASGNAYGLSSTFAVRHEGRQFWVEVKDHLLAVSEPVTLTSDTCTGSIPEEYRTIPGEHAEPAEPTPPEDVPNATYDGPMPLHAKCSSCGSPAGGEFYSPVSGFRCHACAKALIRPVATPRRSRWWLPFMVAATLAAIGATVSLVEVFSK